MKDLTIRRRGFSMIGVMFFALVALVLASTISVMSFAPTALGKKHDLGLECENLAASALNTTFGQLKLDPDFRGTIRVGDERAWAVVSFEPNVARSAGVPLSVNHHDSATPATGTLGRTLPANSIQLFARAKVGPETLTVEHVLHSPPFEYCIASSSAIVASGPMLVAGVDSVEGSSLGELKPGHIAGNGNVALTGPATRVTGDVKAVGSVSRGSGVAVEGQVEERHSSVALPLIPLAAYDPGFDPTVVRQLDASYPGLTVNGLARRSGDLMLNVSGLSLNNGLLYVDGNLTVNGGVTGRGAIICTGDVTVTGGGSLSTTNMAAVVARGKVTLSGSSGAYFRGLVYTETGMEASHLKLVGAFVHRSASGGGEMKLTNCDVVFDPEAVKFEWEIPGFGPVSSGAYGGARLAAGLKAEDFFDKQTGHFDLSRVDGQRVPFSYRNSTYSSLEKAVAAQRGKPTPFRINPDGSRGTQYASWEEFFREGQDQYRSMLSVMDRQYQATKSEAVRRGSFSLDLNQFLNATDSMRVVYWRDFN